MIGRRLAIVASLVALAGVVGAQAASAQTRSPLVTVHIDSIGHDDAPYSTSVDCPNPTVLSQCGASGDGYSHLLTGNLLGIGRYHALATVDPSHPGDANFDGSLTFMGEIVGCGWGTFRATFHGTDHWTNPNINPTAGGGPTAPLGVGANEDANWTLVPGSGTDDLRGLRSGSGTVPGIRYVDTSGDTHWLGTATCVPMA